VKQRAQGLLALAIDRPVTVTVGVILVVMFGLLSLVGLPIQLTPDISRPTIDISTRWPGAAPSEVETEILEAQEQTLKGLAGLVKMTSNASPDLGRITLEFNVGTNIDDALVRVNNRLGEVSSYPEAADRPVLSTSDLSGPAIAVVAIRDLEGGSVSAYRTWVAEEIIPELERIPGVAGMRHVGGQDSEVHIDFDPRALAERGLRINDLADRVRSELRNVSAGELSIGKRSFLVRTPLAPEEVEDLEQVVLGTGPDGTPVRLADVATVSMGLRNPRGVAMTNGRPSMILLLQRESGSNVLAVTEAVRATVADLDQRVFAPEGLSIEVISDQVGYINDALDLVQSNLLMGAVLAILALFFFLRSAGASAIISVSIPVCVFGTALGMNWMGRSINVISLAGVTFAVGMVLDNSIVVLESIDIERKTAKTAAEAALEGVRKVWGAVLASTLTTVAVFAPIIAWESEVGQLLRDVAVAITLAVLWSLVVSVWVVPSLAARLLHPRPADAPVPTPGPLARLGDRLREKLVHTSSWIARDLRRGFVLVALVVAASAGVTFVLAPPLEYLPTGNRNLIFGVLVPPPGYSSAEFERMGRQMDTQISPHIDAEVGGVPSIERSFFVGDGSSVFAGAVATDPNEVGALLTFLRGVQADVPGTFGFTNQSSLFGRGVGAGRTIDVNLVGSDIPTLTELGGRIMGALRTAIPEAQVRPVPGLDPGAPEVQIHPRRRQAAQLGIRSDQLGLMVDALVDGAIVGELTPSNGYEVDVVLRAVTPGRGLITDPLELLDAPLVAGGGEIVPLSAVADAVTDLGPAMIQRLERRRAITLQVSPPESLPLETAVAIVRDQVIEPLVRAGDVPPGVTVELSGAAGDLDVAADQFGQALLLAIVICFLLLSALFEDFLAPLVVLVSLPLAAAGGMACLVAVDQYMGPVPLDLLTALGFLILIGVVVNNAILVVEGAIARLDEGAELNVAVADSVRSRLRPIFMTTVTSLAGLLPMVLSSGAGAELYRGVGAIVLGGLTLSTVLVVFVIPALFTMLYRLRGVR
jgi:HAE1 family hydrophobic/amphiphilic exporter-1